MAEAIAKMKYYNLIESYSAGTELKDRVNQDAQRIIKDKYGYDMEKEGHKNKTIFDVPKPDVAIFMGCDIACPAVPYEYSEDWGLDDPTGLGDEMFLRTIAIIEEKMSELIKKLSINKG
jgi:arsenate reductase